MRERVCVCHARMCNIQHLGSQGVTEEGEVWFSGIGENGGEGVVPGVGGGVGVEVRQVWLKQRTQHPAHTTNKHKHACVSVDTHCHAHSRNTRA